MAHNCTSIRITSYLPIIINCEVIQETHTVFIMPLIYLLVTSFKVLMYFSRWSTMFMRLAPLLTRSLRAAVSSDGTVCIIEINNHLYITHCNLVAMSQ